VDARIDRARPDRKPAPKPDLRRIPVTIAVRCGSKEELLASARGLRGHLTATVHATERDLAEYGAYAMHHGGPWPATTDPRATSVGTAAILRFARPVSFQDVPDGALPGELRDANPRGIWRLVDGQLTKDAL
jgi:alpha-ketoglutaric semialdehyde dehydrogenase